MAEIAAGQLRGIKEERLSPGRRNTLNGKATGDLDEKGL
jgi:hypothetical protein